MSPQVFQTGDLGNLARLDAEGAAKLPTLMALKVRGRDPTLMTLQDL